MSRVTRIHRNNPCPCQSGRKYKHCCEGKVDWTAISSKEDDSFIRNYSLRGKNLAFLQSIFDILEVDPEKPLSWLDVKRACTVEAVREIHKTIPILWPDKQDLERILREERRTVAGLYIGNYHIGQILQGLTRHTLYSDKILLIDPFVDPRRVRSQFSPVENPGMFRVNTLKSLFLWILLAPWIETGIVAFIKSPGDFDPQLAMQSLKTSRARYANSSELQTVMEESIEEEFAGSITTSPLRIEAEYWFLTRSDKEIIDGYLKDHLNAPDEDIKNYLAYIERMRAQHPYYLPINDRMEELKKGEMITMTTGTDYTMAKIIANATGSHFITNLSYRWKEISLDRSGLQGENGWTPFAKAFNGLEFKFLENVPLSVALTLRKQERLKELRLFFNRIWRAAKEEDSFSESNVTNLTSELQHHIVEAEDEWRNIDRDLVKWLGGELIIGVTGAVATGGANWMPPALATIAAGLTTLGVSRDKRRSLVHRYPAAFFLQLKRQRK